MRNKLNFALVTLMLVAFTGTAFAFGEDTRMKNEGATLKIKALQPIAETCKKIKNEVKQDITNVKNYVSEKAAMASGAVQTAKDTYNDKNTQTTIKDEVADSVNTTKSELAESAGYFKQAIKNQKEAIKSAVSMQVTEAKNKIKNNYINPIKSDINQVKTNSGSAVQMLLDKYLTRY